jgi:transcriptional regulator with XRE-family HTH domain
MGTQREDERARIITTLKQLLRGKGMQYTDVAVALDVSERTVQRWLNGEGLTLELVGRLCDLVGATMAELFDLAERATDERPRRLTVKQEQALADTPMVAFLFTRLLQGWSPQEMQRACGLTKAQLIRHLLALERLGLIELHPGNRVRLLTRRNIDWRKGGPMRRHFDKFAKQLMSTMEFGSASSIWTFEAFHLTAGTAALIDNRLQALRLDIRHLAEMERDTPPDEKRWYSLLLLAYCHNVEDPRDPLGSAFALRNITES